MHLNLLRAILTLILGTCIIALLLAQFDIRSQASHLSSSFTGQWRPTAKQDPFVRLPEINVDLKALQKAHPEHYPPYDAYAGRDFDPNRWHWFPREEGFYSIAINVKSASPVQVHSKISKSCIGPHGKPVHNRHDGSFGYKMHWPSPTPVFGSHASIDLSPDVCYTRSSLYGPFDRGSGSDSSPSPSGKSQHDIDWDTVQWGALQELCHAQHQNSSAARRPKPRTAVLLRTWDTYKYQPDDLHAIRALITHLALEGQADYKVFLFVELKNDLDLDHLPSEEYNRLLNAAVPPEFRDMAILWNWKHTQKLYPDVGHNDVYTQLWQPVQWFMAGMHEFEYVWNWELDSRYIGHHLEFLESISKWSARQPRKHLWERSSRTYIPSHHGSWHEFFDYVSSEVQHSHTVWGPQAAIETDSKLAVFPPRSLKDDNFEWGIGEEADLISLAPFWDPEMTDWVHKDTIYNFAQREKMPRRAYINAQSRISRRLFNVMHAENLAGRGMFSEMFPASMCLHYGLKAVFAQHPVWSERQWPADYADHIFNPGHVEATSSRYDAPYSPDREHNFAPMTFYFRPYFSGELYRRWLGWDITDDAGEIQEWESRPNEQMCLPSMLLHPVKGVSFEQRAKYRSP